MTSQIMSDLQTSYKQVIPVNHIHILHFPSHCSQIFSFSSPPRLVNPVLPVTIICHAFKGRYFFFCYSLDSFCVFVWVYGFFLLIGSTCLTSGTTWSLQEGWRQFNRIESWLSYNKNIQINLNTWNKSISFPQQNILICDTSVRFSHGRELIIITRDGTCLGYMTQWQVPPYLHGTKQTFKNVHITYKFVGHT